MRHADSSHPQTRHALVTGGAGFIGSHLAERLVRNGQKVVVLDDLSTGSLDNLAWANGNPQLQFVHSRISACTELQSLVSNASAVYHLAATVGVDLVVQSARHVLESSFGETNVLLKAASAEKVPILLTSTSEVYGKSEKDEFSEDDDLLIGPPTCARWSYACSKLTDEFLALSYARETGLPVIVARLFNTVGPRQTGRYGMVLPRFIAAARAGQPLNVFGDGQQSRCFCYVDDVVEALTRLRDCPAAFGQVFNIGGTEETTITGLATLVIDVLQSDSKIQKVPYDAAYAPGFDDMRRRKPRVDKLHAVTGFRPSRTLREIVQLTARHSFR